MRKMTWALIAWSVLIVVWAVAGSNSAQKNCHATSRLQQDACDAGTGIGVAVIVVLGFFGFVVLSLIWFMTRPREVTYAAPAPPSQARQAPSPTPAAWYPAPGQQMRWWDGTQWTEHTRPRQPGE